MLRKVAYDWSGNIRELKNFLESLVILGFDGKNYNEKFFQEDEDFRRFLANYDIKNNEIAKQSPYQQKTHGLITDDFPFFEFLLNDPVLIQIGEDFKNHKKFDFVVLKKLFERTISEFALVNSNHNISQAAKMVKLPKATFYHNAVRQGLTKEKNGKKLSN